MNDDLSPLQTTFPPIRILDPWKRRAAGKPEYLCWCYQNEICFVSFSFCQNVIIYIIVYANHSLSLPKLSKFCLDFVSILAGGHIMDKRREKNGGVHFSDATIPSGHLFSLFLSVICICQDQSWTLIWITVCTVIWTREGTSTNHHFTLMFCKFAGTNQFLITLRLLFIYLIHFSFRPSFISFISV